LPKSDEDAAMIFPAALVCFFVITFGMQVKESQFKQIQHNTLAILAQVLYRQKL
jgi:hypothetical protein